jgi:hypothetical protein
LLLKNYLPMIDTLNQAQIPNPTLPPEPPPGIPTSSLSPKPLQTPTALPGEPPIKSVISPMTPNKKSSKKLILSIVVVFLLLASIPAAVFLVRQRQEFGKKAYEIQCEPDGYIGPGDCDCNTDGCFGVRWHSKCQDSQIVDYNEQDSSCDGACVGKCGEPTTCENGAKVGDTWPECHGCDEGIVTCKGGTNYDWTSVRNPSPNCGVVCGGEGTRTALQVCQEYGGTESAYCIADPNCKTANGGVCCDKATVNYCCYGDSQTRRDGACYLGGQQEDVVCGGNTITNKTNKSFNVSRFIGADSSCPFESPSGEKTLAPYSSLTASCEQLEVPGYCGVCDSSACSGPEQPTPPPDVSAQCQSIKVYDLSWGLLDATKLSLLQTGDTIRFAVLGQTTSGTFDKARFRINSATWLTETTTKKPGTEEFYIEYTLPAGVTSFNVEAEINHQSLGWQ